MLSLQQYFGDKYLYLDDEMTLSSDTPTISDAHIQSVAEEIVKQQAILELLEDE